MAADVLAGLIAELPEGMVVTDPAVTESYRQDRAFDPSAGKPAAVVRPRRTEEVQTILRWATAHQVPVVTRGMGTGLSGGATRGGRRHRAVDGEDARHRRRSGHPHRGLPTRAAQRRSEKDGRHLWPVVSTRPVVVRDLQHRWQHRDQRGGPVLCEIRRHHRLRARRSGGAGRRHGGPIGRPAAQRRRRAESDQTVRRQ